MCYKNRRYVRTLNDIDDYIPLTLAKNIFNSFLLRELLLNKYDYETNETFLLGVVYGNIFFIADNFGEMEWKECPHNHNDYDESFVCKLLKD